MKEKKALFLKFFGDSPNFRMIDFLLEHRLEDFTKTDIAKGAEISWASLFNHWSMLEEYGVVKQTRQIGRMTLYQLNETSPVVKQLKAIETALIKQAADEEEGKVVVKAKTANRARK
ncbi:Uncharacterised protein [uncultured archaeon]|nr:Uncharacterised protein [uncultured archaeon]